MASLKNIKLKIISYKKTGTVTHAMEAVSAVKMRKSQERALAGRSYAAAALSVLKRLAGTADAERHALVREQLGKTCFVVITSDKGLAGSLNSAVIRRVEDEIRSRALPKNDIVIIAVGRRGGDYFTSRGYEVRMKHENVGDGVSESDIRMVTDNILAWHAAGEIGACVIAYQNFLSTFEQEAGVRQIVPITQEMITDMVKHIRPVKGKYAPAAAEEDKGPEVYTILPRSKSFRTLCAHGRDEERDRQGQRNGGRPHTCLQQSSSGYDHTRSFRDHLWNRSDEMI